MPPQLPIQMPQLLPLTCCHLQHYKLLLQWTELHIVTDNGLSVYIGIYAPTQRLTSPIYNSIISSTIYL